MKNTILIKAGVSSLFENSGSPHPPRVEWFYEKFHEPKWCKEAVISNLD